MKKDNLIKLISKSSGQKRKKCESAFDTIIFLISKSLRNKRNVAIDNFGSFCLKRKKTEIIIIGNYLKKVIPPEDYISFEYSENIVCKEECSDFLDLKEIVSALSVQFNINKEDAGIFAGCIFNAIKDCFRKNRNIEISKLGEFKTIKSNSGHFRQSVNFIPVKKLAKNINHYFNDLNSEVQKYKEIYSEYSDSVPEFKISEEFMSEYKEMCNEREDILKDEVNNNAGDGIRKKLISDELIELHKEITNSVSSEKTEKRTNLWG